MEIKLKAINEIIAARKAKCVDLEERMDQLDDELYAQYMELEYFEGLKREQIQTRLE